MEKIRYPAIPLVTVDPYLSIWSCADNLYDDITRHWTGRRHNMLGLLSVDEKVYRFMGKASADNRAVIEPDIIEQVNVNVYPMRTVYTFENCIVRLTLEFITPLLTDDLKLMSRPVSYISYNVESLDGKEHKIKLYFGMNLLLMMSDVTPLPTARFTALMKMEIKATISKCLLRNAEMQYFASMQSVIIKKIIRIL